MTVGSTRLVCGFACTTDVCEFLCVDYLAAAELAKITVNAQQYAPPVLGKLREWIFAQADAESPKVDYLKNMFALAGYVVVAMHYS